MVASSDAPRPRPQVYPDLLEIIGSGVSLGELALSLASMFFAAAFTALQLHWSFLLYKQVKKALRPAPRPGGADDDLYAENYETMAP